MAVRAVMKGQIIQKTARKQNHLTQGKKGRMESLQVLKLEKKFFKIIVPAVMVKICRAAGPDLTEVGSNYSQDEIADIVENGTDGGMPAFSDLEDDDLDELAKWLSEHK